jgi:hypothetical protein
VGKGIQGKRIRGNGDQWEWGWRKEEQFSRKVQRRQPAIQKAN